MEAEAALAHGETPPEDPVPAVSVQSGWEDGHYRKRRRRHRSRDWPTVPAVPELVLARYLGLLTSAHRLLQACKAPAQADQPRAFQSTRIHTHRQSTVATTMSYFACLPFASEPLEAFGEESSELLKSQLSGLRSQTETLQRGPSGSAAAAEPCAVLGASAGLLSAVDVPVVPLVDEAGGVPPMDPSSAKALSSSEDAAKADHAYQQRCFAAVAEGRRDAFHKLVRRRVLHERERARGADVASELLELDAAIAAMPPLGPNPVPVGVSAEDAAALGGGDAALFTGGPAPPVPSPMEIELLLRRRVDLRKRLAPMHAYLGGLSGAHSTHGRALLHEAAWAAPIAVDVDDALGPSPLPPLRRNVSEVCAASQSPPLTRSAAPLWRGRPSVHPRPPVCDTLRPPCRLSAACILGLCAVRAAPLCSRPLLPFAAPVRCSRDALRIASPRRPSTALPALLPSCPPCPPMPRRIASRLGAAAGRPRRRHGRRPRARALPPRGRFERALLVRHVNLPLVRRECLRERRRLACRSRRHGAPRRPHAPPPPLELVGTPRDACVAVGGLRVCAVGADACRARGGGA